MNKPKTVIFVGKSGSGKGTQSRLLTEKLNKVGKTLHLESGARFRDFIENNKTYTADLARKINDEGGLQPQFLSAWVWTNELVEKIDEDTNLVIDGTPRRLPEAHVLETAFDFYKRENISIFYLKISDYVAIDRLKERGRSDDIDENDVLEKLRWFNTDVCPVVDYYRTNDYYHFYEINGEKSEEEIHQEVLDILKI